MGPGGFCVLCVMRLSSGSKLSLYVRSPKGFMPLFGCSPLEASGRGLGAMETELQPDLLSPWPVAPPPPFPLSPIPPSSHACSGVNSFFIYYSIH